MERPADIISGLYRSFARGNLSQVYALLDPEVRWVEAEGYPYAGTYVGPNAVRTGVFERLAAEWSSYTTVPHTLVSEGDTVVALGEYAGTSRLTGKSFRAPFAHVFRLSDSRIISFLQFTDTWVVQSALR